MSAEGVHCIRCGFIDPEAEYGANCKVCQTKLIERKQKKGASADDAVYGIVPAGQKAGSLMSKIKSSISKEASQGAKPAFRGKTPRFRVTKLTEEPGIDKTRFKQVSDSMRDQGFIPVLDRVNLAIEPPLPERLFANKEKKLYAMACFPKGEEAFARVIFIPAEGGKAVVVSSEPADALPDPKTKRTVIPGVETSELVKEMLGRAKPKNREPKPLSVKALAMELADSQDRMFGYAMENGALVRADDVAAASSGQKTGTGIDRCAYHENEMAVRKCGTCGKTVCEECRNVYSGAEYCPKCLPKGAKTMDEPDLDFSGDLRPAGFTIRAAVRVVEVCALLWLIVTLFPAGGSAVSKIAYQFIAFTGFVSYFLFPVASWGATPLGLAAGLSVIDAEGEELGFAASFARTGYMLVSMITVLPLAGYLPAILDKYGRGWHDRMAGTIVVVSGNPSKSTAGGVVLLAAVALAVLNLASISAVITETFDQAYGVAPSARALELEPVWVKQLDKAGVSPVMDGERVVVVENGDAVAYDTSGGGLVWKSMTGAIAAVYKDPYANFYLLGQADSGGGNMLTAVSTVDGAEAWSVELDSILLFPPAFGRKLIFATLEDKIIAFNRFGKIEWENETRAASQPIIVKGRVMAMIDDEGRFGAAVFDAQRGRELAYFEDMRPAAPGDGSRYIFSGPDGTSLIDITNKKTLWSIPGYFSFIDGGKPPTGELYYAVETVLTKEDGAPGYPYPDGCAYTGYLKHIAMLSCPGEGRLKVIDRESGALLSKLDAPDFDRAYLAGEDGGAYYILTMKHGPGGDVTAGMLALDRLFRSAIYTKLGRFMSEPQVKYFAESKTLFIASGASIGEYHAPWIK